MKPLLEQFASLRFRAARNASIALCAYSVCLGCFAEEPIDTDGPDYVESTEVVGERHFQVEVGVNRELEKRIEPNVRTVTTPVLLRYGISDTFELRLETDGKTWESGSPSSQIGVADTAIGFKWHAQDKNTHTNTPAVSWIFQAELPTGTKNFRGHGARPSLRSVIGWDLPGSYSLGVMPGIKYDKREDGRGFASGSFGIVFGKRWTEKFRTFVEFAAPQIARAENGGTLLYQSIGAAYLISNDVQIGGRIGWRANTNTPDMYYLLSAAIRF
jgi:hypothetical protein